MIRFFSNFGKAGMQSSVAMNRKIVGFPRGKLRKQRCICVIVKSLKLEAVRSIEWWITIRVLSTPHA